MAFQSARQAGQPSNSVCAEQPHRRQRKTRSGHSSSAGGQDAGDGLQFFGRNSQDGSPRCGFGTHSVVRLAVVPLSGAIAGSACASPAVNIRGNSESCAHPGGPRRTGLLNKAGRPAEKWRGRPESRAWAPTGAQTENLRGPMPRGYIYRKCMAMLRKTRPVAAGARRAMLLTTGDLDSAEGRFASPHWTRFELSRRKPPLFEPAELLHGLEDSGRAGTGIQAGSPCRTNLELSSRPISV